MKKVNEERKFINMKTSEVLDRIDILMKSKADMDWTEERELEAELEYRRPFVQFKRVVENQDRRIKYLENIIDALLNHKHTGGEVVIKITEASAYVKDSSEKRVFV
jgi:hypothetical protein